MLFVFCFLYVCLFVCFLIAQNALAQDAAGDDAYLQATGAASTALTDAADYVPEADPNEADFFN